jgi:hypothetical protein
MSVSDSAPDLSWLADSPMFIDSQQIGAFYDAVVGPAFRTVELQITASRTEQAQKTGGGSATAGLSSLFPWLKAEAQIEGSRTTMREQQDGQSIVLQPVESAARQLVQLSQHYLQPAGAYLPGRPRHPAPGRRGHRRQPADGRIRRRPAGRPVPAASRRAQ